MVVMYYVCTILALLTGAGLSVWGQHRHSDVLCLFGGVTLVIFFVMLIGVWNLAASAAKCCGA